MLGGFIRGKEGESAASRLSKQKGCEVRAYEIGQRGPLQREPRFAHPD